MARSDSDDIAIVLPEIEPLTVEQKRMLLEELLQTARLNYQTVDSITMELIAKISLLSVEQVAQEQELVRGSTEFLTLQENQANTIWALYPKAPTETLELYLAWVRAPLQEQPIEKLHALAASNRATATAARAKIINRLATCHAEVARRRLTTDLDSSFLGIAFADKYWALLGSTVPERIIEIQTALVCDELA